MADGFDGDGGVFDGVAAGEDAGPEIEALVDVFEVVDGGEGAVGAGEFEAELPEAEAVGVGPEVLGGGVVLESGVVDRATVGVEGFEGIGELVALGVGEAVPAPVGEGAERDAFFVDGGEGLEAGDIDCHGEAPVAQGEGGEGIDGGGVGGVAGREGLAVNGAVGGKKGAG